MTRLFEMIAYLLAFIKSIFRPSANIDDLYNAIRNGNMNEVNRLLAFPAVVNNITAPRNYALELVAANGHLNVVNRLLEFPAVVERITGDGNRALQMAARSGHLDIMNRLLEFPAVVERITAWSNYALGLAAENGYLDVVNRLLEFPAVRAAVLAADDADENLRTIAQNTESSMRALNLQEQGIVNALEQLYPF